MREYTLWSIFLLPLLVLLTGCNNSVEEVSRLPAITPPTPGVSVELNQDLQSVMALDGKLVVQLSMDDTQSQSMSLTNTSARLDLTATQMRGEHRYYIAMQYIDNGTESTVLVAEAEKYSSESQVLFAAEDLYTKPYDKDGSGTIEPTEQQALDADLDKRPNLTEILEGGNPQNPGPTFTSDTNAQVPERQSQPGGTYPVYNAKAISSNPEATVTFSIAGGAAANRFSVNSKTGVLSFVTDIGKNITWPAYIPTANNDYSVIIVADDGSLSNAFTVTITVTDVFNLQAIVGIKSLNFSWFEVPGADYYKLLENPDGNSGFSEVVGGARIKGLSFSHSITLYRFDAAKARFMLQAYTYDINNNLNNLLESSEALTITDSLLAAVGFMKAPNVNVGNYLGTVIELSADGNTLAVGVASDDSGAVGLNGDPQNDCNNADGSKNLNSINCALDSGAVYLYLRNGGSNSGQWDKGDFAAYIKSPKTKLPNSSVNDAFGSSIGLSADGTTLAVGAFNDASGKISDGLSGDSLNDCLAPLGGYSSTALNCIIASGAVYIFQRSGGNSEIWDDGDYVAFIKAPYPTKGGGFGFSLDLSANGDILAVGAFRENSAATVTSQKPNPIDSCIGVSASSQCLMESGAVYLFERERGGYSGKWDSGDYSAFIKAPNADRFDWFGSSLSLSADGATLAVGALMEDSAAASTGLNGNQQDDCYSINSALVNCVMDSGAVYIFQRGNGNSATWDDGDRANAVYIKALNARKNAGFGALISLSADGATLAVGSPSSSAMGLNGDLQDDCLNADGTKNPTPSNCKSYSGAVYLYEKNKGDSGQWAYTAYLKAPNAGEYDAFGASVSLNADGSTLAVGASGESSGVTSATAGLNANPQDDCTNADGSVNTAANNCIIMSGAAYLFQRGNNSTQWVNGNYSNTAYIKAINAGEKDYFGSAISLSDDGATLAVGASNEDSGAVNNGFNGNPQNDCINEDGSPNTVSKNCAINSGAVYLY